MHSVAALVAAWIEIQTVLEMFDPENSVAALVAAWIEIVHYDIFVMRAPSPPLWRRGLK